LNVQFGKKFSIRVILIIRVPQPGLARIGFPPPASLAQRP